MIYPDFMSKLVAAGVLGFQPMAVPLLPTMRWYYTLNVENLPSAFANLIK